MNLITWSWQFYLFVIMIFKKSNILTYIFIVFKVSVTFGDFFAGNKIIDEKRKILFYIKFLEWIVSNEIEFWIKIIKLHA